MPNALFWVYLINAIFLINHEIESAYWKEWNLFKLKGGITGFLIIHFPLLLIILIGLAYLYEITLAGLILSFLLSAGGIFAFSIHTYFIRKGKEEFTLPISYVLLLGTLVLSIAQIVLTLLELIV
ncbi:MAG: hypothetical protein H7641_01765 [Candidatus Heimdallarchaeota archaeon]|nr:hypothetical protein [Candidatus Heimdallarchaeota archaeon]MCK4876290.1 hypothetical protein [Candidatus Heimdallarchaeota archaeon]